MASFARFGEQGTPFAEPAWYRGLPTPYYEEKHVLWRAKVRAFVDKELAPFAHEWDEKATFPIAELRRKAYEAGVLSPCYPVELGGTPPEGGWDEFMFTIWIDELTRGQNAGVMVTLFGITIMSLPHTLKYGSEFLKQTVARPVIEGKAGMSITLTEPAGGSDLANLATTAIKTDDGKHYIVNGVKKFITGGLTSQFFSTAVRTGGDGHGGISLLVIDKSLPGVTVRKLPAQGWWSSNTTLVVFEDVKVPVEYLIGEEGLGFYYLVDVMNGERMYAVVSAARGARLTLHLAVQYARERNSFGKRLIDHQVIRHKIAHMAKMVESLWNTIEALTFQLNNNADPRKIGGPVALLKVQSTQTLEFCVREASQILGGASFLRTGKGEALERAVREVRVATVGGGSEEILIDLAMRMSKL